MLEIKFKKQTATKQPRIAIGSEETKVVMNNQYHDSICIALYDGRELYVGVYGDLEFFDKDGYPVDNW